MEKITLDDYFDLMSYLRSLGFHDYALIGYNDSLRLILDNRGIRSDILNKLVCKYNFKMYSTTFEGRQAFEISLLNLPDKTEAMP